MIIKLELYIDSAGARPERVVIGLVSFNSATKDSILDDFFRTFPDFVKRKGRNLTLPELKSVLSFLNQRKVRMATRSFSPNDWLWMGSNYGDRAYCRDKIYGMLYFQVIRTIAWKGFRYSVTTCVESHSNILRIQKYCNRLAEFNNIRLEFSQGIDSMNRYLKIADLVASAGRRLKRDYLRKIENFKVVTQPIPDWVLWKLFK